MKNALACQRHLRYNGQFSSHPNGAALCIVSDAARMRRAMSAFYPVISSSTPSGSLPPGTPADGAPRHDDGGAADTAVKPRLHPLKPPAMYQVLLINDDFTPMEFVVLILQEIFNKDLNTATSIMFQVHTEGKGICGVYTRDIAQTKTYQVMQAARLAGHPLQCVFEPVPE